MSITLYCYTDLSPAAAQAAIQKLAGERPDIFSYRFLVWRAAELNPVKQEIARDFGFEAQSYFCVSLNDKSASHLVIEVAQLIETALRCAHARVLFENEKILCGNEWRSEHEVRWSD